MKRIRSLTTTRGDAARIEAAGALITDFGVATELIDKEGTAS